MTTLNQLWLNWSFEPKHFRLATAGLVSKGLNAKELNFFNFMFQNQIIFSTFQNFLVLYYCLESDSFNFTSLLFSSSQIII